MIHFLLLATAVIFNTGSSVLYKVSSLCSSRGAGFLALSAGLLLGVINAVLYTQSLKGIRLNIAYPVFSTASIVLVFALSSVLFGENVTSKGVAGVAIVCCGIFLIAN